MREKLVSARKACLIETVLRRIHNKFLFHTPHKSLLSSLSSHNEKWEKLRIKKKERNSPAYMPFEEIFLIHFHPKSFDGLLLEAFVFQTERTNGWTDRWIHLISTWFRFFPFLSIYYFFFFSFHFSVESTRKFSTIFAFATSNIAFWRARSATGGYCGVGNDKRSNWTTLRDKLSMREFGFDCGTLCTDLNPWIWEVANEGRDTLLSWTCEFEMIKFVKFSYGITFNFFIII